MPTKSGFSWNKAEKGGADVVPSEPRNLVVRTCNEVEAPSSNLSFGWGNLNSHLPYPWRGSNHQSVEHFWACSCLSCWSWFSLHESHRENDYILTVRRLSWRWKIWVQVPKAENGFELGPHISVQRAITPSILDKWWMVIITFAMICEKGFIYVKGVPSGQRCFSALQD